MLFAVSTFWHVHRRQGCQQQQPQLKWAFSISAMFTTTSSSSSSAPRLLSDRHKNILLFELESLRTSMFANKSLMHLQIHRNVRICAGEQTPICVSGAAWKAVIMWAGIPFWQLASSDLFAIGFICAWQFVKHFMRYACLYLHRPWSCSSHKYLFPFLISFSLWTLIF